MVTKMSTKNEVLAILEKSRGSFVSGQELADKLNISRSAVWKAIRALDERGLKVRAVRNRGYMLDGGSDVLSEEGIAAFLPERFSDCRIIYMESVDSTNALAKRLAPEDAASGTIIVAGEQTEGRGRSGKSFFSPAGSGLYMSVVLRPENPPARPQMTTVAAALSVCRAIEKQAPLTPGIKWVNDIMLDGKKVCGILTEAVTDLEGGGIDCIIVGIGINCRTPLEGAFPGDIRDYAGALDFPGLLRGKLAADIASNLLDTFENLEDKALTEEYRQRSVMQGKRVGFVYNGRRVEADVQGIDDDCGLVVVFDDGERVTLTGGEVSIGRNIR